MGVDVADKDLRKYFPNVLLIIDPGQFFLPFIHTFSKYTNVYPVYYYTSYLHKVIHGLPLVKPIRNRIDIRDLRFLLKVFNAQHKLNIPYINLDNLSNNLDMIFVWGIVCNIDLKRFRDAIKIYYAHDCSGGKTKYLHLASISLSDYDYILVDHRYCIDEYKKLSGAEVLWMPYAFYPELHRPLNVQIKYDLSFIGNLAGFNAQKRIKTISYIKSRRPDLRTFFGNAYYHHMVLIYNQSKVVLNISRAGELTWRDFEVLGCGRPLLRDYSSEVEELFKDRVHLVFYRDEEDLLDKLDWLLSDDETRARIASQGHKEALEKHTMDHRITYLLKRVGLWEAGLGVDLGVPSGGSGSL